MAGLLNVAFREESLEDVGTIRDLTYRAFLPVSFSKNTEAAALDRMRSDGDLVLSLVAENPPGDIVGHIAFSPMQSHKGWYALGPISVTTKRQKQGIGRALIQEGKKRLLEKKPDALGIVLIGNPAIYSSSSGFRSGSLSYRTVPPAYVLRLCFTQEDIDGKLVFCRGLEDSV